MCINREASAKTEGAVKSRIVDMEGCPLILHFLIVEYIPASRSDLKAVTSPRMLRWGVIPQYKTMKIQRAFSSKSLPKISFKNQYSIITYQYSVDGVSTKY